MVDPEPKADLEGRFRYLDLITALFVAVLLISNTVSTKMVRFGPFNYDGGTLLFPLSYLFGDLLTEVYGYARSRRVIWTGFGCLLLMTAMYLVVDLLPAAFEGTPARQFHEILGFVWRISLASFIAYFAGEFTNSYVLAKMKILTRGRFLWTRTIGSTIAGEGVDTTLFVAIAFLGAYPLHEIWTVWLSNYVFKVGVEALATPITYRVVAFLKRREGIDHYDYGTRFSPFRWAAQ